MRSRVSAGIEIGCSRILLHTLVLLTVFAARIHSASSLEVSSARSPTAIATHSMAIGLEPAPGAFIDQASPGDTLEGASRNGGLRLSFLIVFLSGIIVGVGLTISLQAMMNKAAPEGQPQEPETSFPSDAMARAGASEDDIETKYMEAYDIEHFWPRCSFLCLLLVLQSGSSILLEWFQPLLENYTSLVFYFTMLVGLGGNAGVQSVVISVRRFAMKQPVSIWEQARVGIYLALVLAPLAFLRCYVQATDLSVCVVIGIAAAVITTLATGFGTALSVALVRMGVDPAHASPAVQVMMDMIGLTVVCSVATLWVQVGWLTPAN
mmetsp:Transcript_14769/g.25967  ORF Transcript_14769/g.25967 Transcript_14769/m.25967 type:complete len:322 (+) Transcript_14769:74-1039(+)